MDTKIDLGAMQRRVDDLGARIRALRQRVKTGIDPARAAEQQLVALEQRHSELAAALGELHRPGAPATHGSIVDKLAKDLDASIGNFTDWVDAEDHPAPPPGGFSP